jgi:hypothetical protein
MISVADLTEWLKAEAGDADLIADLEAAAVELVSRYTGRYFGAAGTITEYLSWRGGTLQLANEPTGAVTLSERSSDGSWSAVDTSGYYVDGRLVFMTGAVPLTVSHLRAQYTAGYASGAEPEVAKQAVRILVATWFENREAVVVGVAADEVPMSVQMLLRAL